MIDKKMLLNAFNTNKTKLKFGKEIGAGVDGSVYLSDNKVIKLSPNLDSEQTESIINTVDYLYHNPLHTYTHVYDYGYEKNSNFLQEDRYCVYYTMPILNHLSQDEAKVFHTILSHEDNNVVKNYSQAQIYKILQGLSKGLDFDESKVMLFVEALKAAPIIHLDIHPRNIMKDDLNNFKMIDLNRVKFKH